MHTSKFKLAIVALLTLFLIAACGGDDNNGTNNGTTNNGGPADDGNDAGDSPDGNDGDGGAEGTSGGTGGGDLPASFIGRSEDARTASETYFTTYCDCYTESLYGGDRAACESSVETGDGADPAEANQCEIDVFNQYEQEFLALFDCVDQEMSEANQCLSSCPAPSELGTCTEGLQDCTVPQAAADALEACQSDGA